MSRIEKPQEIATTDIHDNPLLHYPHVIVALMRQRAIKIVKAELAATREDGQESRVNHASQTPHIALQQCHCALQHSVKSSARIFGGECPLWVISGHSAHSVRCPLYPQKRTWISAAVMSALCQKMG